MITTEFKPYRDVSFQYESTGENYEPGMPIGYGATVKEAEENLKEQIGDERAPGTIEGYCAMMEPLAFITELESRSMSTWTDAEGTRYCELTGQAPWEPWSSDYEVSLRRQENL